MASWHWLIANHSKLSVQVAVAIVVPNISKWMMRIQHGFTLRNMSISPAFSCIGSDRGGEGGTLAPGVGSHRGGVASTLISWLGIMCLIPVELKIFFLFIHLHRFQGAPSVKSS